MKTSINKLVAVLFIIGCTLAAQAQNWPHWRGPSFNGAVATTGGGKLPEDFSPNKNVKWTAPLPGPAAATPIVWENRVFVSATDPASKNLVAMCFDTATGKQLWDDR